MKEDILNITTLQNVMDYDARLLSSAEAQLESTLPEWISKANSATLKNVLQKYFENIKQHYKVVEKFLSEEKNYTLIRNNNVMQAFITEANTKLTNCTDAEVLDACLLSSIQAINHYKISMYGTAAAFAKALGYEQTAAIFHEAEVTEKQIDDRLSQLAEYEINLKARSPIINNKN